MRIPEMDDLCAWCDFEGLAAPTFYYNDKGGYHWCSWHRSEVPAVRNTRPEQRTPPAAMFIESPFKEVKQSGRRQRLSKA